MVFAKKKFPDIKIYTSKKDAVCIDDAGKKKQSSILNDIEISEFIQFVSNLQNSDDFLEKEKEILDGWKIFETQGSVHPYNAKENALISSDTIFSIHIVEQRLTTETTLICKKSIDRIYKVISENTRVYPGHNISDFTLKENL